MRDRTLHGFYTALASNTALVLEPSWQRRIATYAHQNRKAHLLALLLRRSDVTAELVAELADHSGATVKAAWLTHHAANVDEVVARVRTEKRPKVLATAVAFPGLPGDVFDRIAGLASGSVELTVAAVATGRCTPAVAYDLIGSVASARSLVKDGFVAQLHTAARHYPLTFNRLLARTDDAKVATLALTELRSVHPDVEAADTRKAVTAALGAVTSVTPLSSTAFSEAVELLTAINGSELQRAHIDEIVRFGIDELRVVAEGVFSSGHYQLKKLTELEANLSDVFDELASTLISGDDDKAQFILEEAQRVRSALPTHPRRAGYGRLANAIFRDESYSDATRCEALDAGLRYAYELRAEIVAKLERHPVRLTDEMVAALHWRDRYHGLKVVLAAADDPDTALDRLLERPDAGLLTQASDLGLLDDRRLTLVAEHTHSGWFADMPAHPVFARLLQHMLELADRELGTDDSTVEFFEACFETVGENPVGVARLASTST